MNGTDPWKPEQIRKSTGAHYGVEPPELASSFQIRRRTDCEPDSQGNLTSRERTAWRALGVVQPRAVSRELSERS